MLAIESEEFVSEEKVRDLAVWLISDLTPTELIVLQHAGIGGENKEIAGRLCRSPETVKEHLQSIRNKLEAKTTHRFSRACLTFLAIASGLVKLGDATWSKVECNSNTRRCWECGNVAIHKDHITPWVNCFKCGSQDTRKVK